MGLSFLAIHLPFLASAPATIDSVNFLLGVREFNIADHRPHPPGYPIFIALGKISTTVLAQEVVQDSVRNGSQALAVWGALFGALAILPLFLFFRSLELTDRRAVAATALTVTCPLFWFTAARPMSDIPGLVAGLSAQALIITAFRRSDQQDPRRLLIGALAAGIAIGFRSQNAWLTIPLLIWVTAATRPPRGVLVQVIGIFTLGLALWAVFLLHASGGLHGYLDAVRAQGYEDLAAANILATNLTPARFLEGLVQTFAYPWAETALAAATMAFTFVGAGVMMTRSRDGAWLLAASVVPYGIFHLLFQESVHTRYALPLVPAVAYLAVRGLDFLGDRAMPSAVAGLSLAGVLIAVPPAAAYARAGTPVSQAINDIRDQASRELRAPALAMHHAVARMLRGEPLPLQVLPPSAPSHEWLNLVTHWRTAPDRPVWFLAEAGRNDLALVDPASRRMVRSYGWAFQRKFVMSRVPATGLDWYEMNPPGWMAAEGWALSPEAAGVALRDGQGPAGRPIVAYVKRRNEATVLMVGGRNRSGSNGPTARFELSLGQRAIQSWDVVPDEELFLRMWRLPAGTLSGPEGYMPLQIRAVPVGESSEPLQVAIDQFDLQADDAIVRGFDSGWYQEEYDGAAPRAWRWSGPSAGVRVNHAGKNVLLRVVGEAPIKYLDGPLHVSVRAGNRPLARVELRHDAVDFQVRIPAEALDESHGFLTIDLDRTFVPDEAMENGDKRRLGLRVYQLELTPDTANR